MTKRRDPPPEPTDVRVLASVVRYVGSAEHKRYPSPAGEPHLRSDASECPKQVSFEQAQAWLREAFEQGLVSRQFEGRFPRKAWMRRAGRVWEARLTNREKGEYKGYPVDPEIDDIPGHILKSLR